MNRNTLIDAAITILIIAAVVIFGIYFYNRSRAQRKEPSSASITPSPTETSAPEPSPTITPEPTFFKKTPETGGS